MTDQYLRVNLTGGEIREHIDHIFAQKGPIVPIGVFKQAFKARFSFDGTEVVSEEERTRMGEQPLSPFRYFPIVDGRVYGEGQPTQPTQSIQQIQQIQQIQLTPDVRGRSKESTLVDMRGVPTKGVPDSGRSEDDILHYGPFIKEPRRLKKAKKT